jgi:putative tricarboxylic transport membrane protein
VTTVNRADPGRTGPVPAEPSGGILHRLVRAGDVVASTVLTLLGVVAAAAGLGYGAFVDGGRVGPGYVPLFAGVLLAGLGAAMLVLAVRSVAGAGTGGADPDAEPGADIFGRTHRQRMRILWSVLGLTLLAVVLVPYVGFLVAFGLLVLIVSVLVEGRRVLPSLAVTVATVAVTYGVFGLFLQIPLPVGLLGQALGVQ